MVATVHPADTDWFPQLDLVVFVLTPSSPCASWTQHREGILKPDGLPRIRDDNVAIEPQLDRDIVIPNPWEPIRLQNAFSMLRPGGAWGRWREDKNHQIELWEPIGIGWVHGGNHSICAGILTAAGTVTPDFGYDITPIYKHVVCDGRTFRRVHDRAVISDVASIEMAAIFEIGRLMIDRPARSSGRATTKRS